MFYNRVINILGRFMPKSLGKDNQAAFQASLMPFFPQNAYRLFMSLAEGPFPEKLWARRRIRIHGCPAAKRITMPEKTELYDKCNLHVSTSFAHRFSNGHLRLVNRLIRISSLSGSVFEKTRPPPWARILAQSLVRFPSYTHSMSAEYNRFAGESARSASTGLAFLIFPFQS